LARIIQKGGYVMNTISHRVYQTGEGERESDRPRTSENQASVQAQMTLLAK